MADWGPTLWSEFHAFAVSYTGNKESAKDYYYSFASKIPCRSCKIKYQSLIDGRMRLSREHLESRDALFAWSWVFHNVVNMMLQKPQMSLEEATKLHGY